MTRAAEVGLVETRYVSNGEAGDGQVECTCCGEETDDPHTWDVCAANLRKERDMLLDALADAQVAAMVDRDREGAE